MASIKGDGRGLPPFGSTNNVVGFKQSTANAPITGNPEPEWVRNGARTPTFIDSATVTAYTASFGEVVIVDTTTAAVTVTLPTPGANIQHAPVSVKRLAGSNTLTIAFAAKIDGGSTGAGSTATTGKTYHAAGTDYYSMP